MSLLSWLLLACAATPATPPAAQAPVLTVRNAHAMAYDSHHRRVLLFGGADERQVLGDLWAWDGRAWTRLSAAGPPPRTFAAAAYDPDRRRLVVFGGNRVLFGTPADTATFLGDHWEWDGARWHAVDGPTPPPRAEGVMAYDRDRRRLVLFGGYRVQGGQRTRLGDTWEWDGTRWTQVAAQGPSPRNGAAMAYDTHRKHTVLFGGNGPSAETWRWDGRAWTRLDAGETPGRFNPAMAFDEARRAVVRFGGWNGQAREGDTWTYDRSGWRRLAETGPEPRNHAALAYDAIRRRLVLFGGHDGARVFGDTWEWDGERWHRRGGHAPLERVENGH